MSKSSEKTSAHKPSDNGLSPGPEPTADRGDAWEADGQAEAGATAGQGGPDPFDPEALRMPADFSAAVGVQKVLLAVPVRKPDKSWWVRVHPDEAYRLSMAVVELREDRGSESFLVAPALRAELATEPTFRVKLFATAINRQGTLFLWEANLPRPDGRADDWSRTALEAVELATRSWIRISANMGAGHYEVFRAAGQLADPEWPAKPFSELLRVAFKDRYIDSPDHPVLRRLRGEV